MRTSTRRPAVLAAAAVAALSLSLTACGGDDKAAGSATPPSSASEQSSPGASSAGEGQTDGQGQGQGQTKDNAAPGSTTGSGAPGSSATQTGAKKPGKGKVPACTVDDVKMSATTNAEPPFSYLELTAKNTSGRTCQLVAYPQVTFGDFHTAKVIPAVAKSKPAAPVVLEPGAPAYAKIKINYGGVDEAGVERKEFNVQVFAAGGGAQEGAEIVTVPRAFHVDEKNAKTGYWTHEFRNGADDF